MSADGGDRAALLDEVASLRARLVATESLLEAIRRGEVDAIFAERGGSGVAFTLDGADRPYRELLEHLSEGVATLAHDGTIVFCNGRFATLLGRPLDQLVGRPLEGLLGPRDRATFRALRARCDAPGGHETGRCALEELAAPVQLAMRTAPRGGEVSLAVVATDLSEERRVAEALRRSEERFRTLADAAPVLIWRADLDRSRTWFNRSWLEFTGRAQEQERGDGWAVGVHPDDHERCVRTYDESFGARRAFKSDYRLRRADGKYRWILEHGVPEWSADGTFAGYLGSCIDVTEHKRAEAELRRLNDTLAEQVEKGIAELRTRDQALAIQSRHAAMGEMIGNIAHQWRQPLNALSMVMANLVDAHAAHELDDALVALLAQQASQLIHKMSSTITDFQEFFRPNRARAWFALDDVVRDALTLTNAACRQAHVEVEVAGAGDVRVHGFPSELSQVLLNLIANAVQAIGASGRGEGHIRIGLGVDGGYALLCVRDDGGGIDAAILDRIFDPYFSTREQGTGLGLYMSKQLVERSLGGTLTARNVDGGAELCVRVPVPPDPRGG